MEKIKFRGINKKSSIKKAISFFYDNDLESGKVEVFLAKCRIQSDGVTIHYYPFLEVDVEKFKDLKKSMNKKRRERKK